LRAFDRLWSRYAALSIRKPTLLSLAGLVVFIAAVPGAARLYGDLRTDLRELLPRGAPAAVALEELEQRVGGLSHLEVVVRTGDFRAGARFVDALGPRLQRLPKNLVSRVQWKIDEERAFLDTHGALYADIEDLRRLDAALTRRVVEAKRRANPLAIDLLGEDNPNGNGAANGASSKQEKVDPQLEAALARIKAAFSRVDRFPEGYLAGENSHTFVVIITPPGAAVSLEDDQAIYNAVKREVDALNPKSFDPSLFIGYAGEVRGVIEAQEALVRDLFLSSVLVLVAVTVALYAYFRSMRALPLLVLPLALGTTLTFAISRGFIHYLNPNTAFLGSIIVGNGINAAIILLARYLEERRNGSPVDQALPAALRHTYLATFAASGGAAASYGSLLFVRFRGFNQFGFMGSVGMLLCWLATYLIMPPLIAAAENLIPFGEGGRHSRRIGHLTVPLARVLVRHARLGVAISAALIALSMAALVRFSRDPIQYDFGKLGSRQGAIEGAGMWGTHVDAVLQSYQTPTVVLTDAVPEALAVADALEKAKEREGARSTIDSVATLAKLVPPDQQAKIDLLRHVFSMITPRVLASLPEDDRTVVQRLLRSTQLKPISLADVPVALKGIFQEKNGGEDGRLVLVYPTLETDSAHGREQIRHAQEVRRIATAAAPRARVAGEIVLTADIVQTIIDDGVYAGLLSFVAVALLTLLIMRSVRHASWVLASLCVGVLWMFGALGAFAIKFNFVNFVVLPITFGIGVDYAVNLYERYREHDDVERALASSGGAVALCSSTTIIGYAALIIADNQAIQSFGLTAVIGEIACLSAALLALPALLAWHDERRAPPPAKLGRTGNGVEPNIATAPITASSRPEA
jgi:predicted RND superfamily exporter protein